VYRDKEVVGVFVCVFRAPLRSSLIRNVLILIYIIDHQQNGF
jgi:hypothetical protein